MSAELGNAILEAIDAGLEVCIRRELGAGGRVALDVMTPDIDGGEYTGATSFACWSDEPFELLPNLIREAVAEYRQNQRGEASAAGSFPTPRPSTPSR